MAEQAFDLAVTYAHLGLGARVIPLRGFEWTKEYLDSYEADTAGDGVDGRLVMISASEKSWPSWERHPCGEELVVLLSGQLTLIQEADGEERRIEMIAGHAAINPKGVWHTADLDAPSRMLFITPGRGTEHRPR